MNNVVEVLAVLGILELLLTALSCVPGRGGPGAVFPFELWAHIDSCIVLMSTGGAARLPSARSRPHRANV